MKLHRVLLVTAAVAVLASVAYVAQLAEPSGARMATAAERFLASLQPEQKTRATFSFDDKERINWHFVPLQDKNRQYTRKGMPLVEMTAEQKKAALELVRAGTSETGYVQATTIMALESILHELEKNGTNVRNPEWYFFSIFGTPSKTGKWGWRVEGHHLSLNFTLDGGQVVSATPCFYGANPADVQSGAKKGQRTLAEAQDLARELFNSLDDSQKKVALQDKQFPEIEQAKSRPNVGEPRGLPAARMTDKQRAVLVRLIESYANRLPPDIAAVELKQVQEAGIDKVHFGYAGGVEPGKPYTYRIQGPTFVVEFLNVQADSAGNPANHIHSAWRNLKGDFGTN